MKLISFLLIILAICNTLTPLSPTDEEWLLKIGMAEAGNTSVECIAAVMRVVLNRVNDPRFKNNVYDVIYQKGQFTPTEKEGFKYIKPNRMCYEALLLIELGWDKSEGALYFETLKSEDNWFSKNLHYLFKIKNMRFYK